MGVVYHRSDCSDNYARYYCCVVAGSACNYMDRRHADIVRSKDYNWRIDEIDKALGNW
jgi:hypothetical protein